MELAKSQKVLVDAYIRMKTLKTRLVLSLLADARATVAKVKRVNKPFARKIQILTVGEQRAKVMGKNKVAGIFKRGKEAIRKARGK